LKFTNHEILILNIIVSVSTALQKSDTW